MTRAHTHLFGWERGNVGLYLLEWFKLTKATVQLDCNEILQFKVPKTKLHYG